LGSEWLDSGRPDRHGGRALRRRADERSLRTFPPGAKEGPMPDVRMPLSGDVSQLINPFLLFFRAIGSQFGLVNINLGKSADPDVEQRILEDVGSYGRQLGRIGDALRVLIDQAERTAPDLAARPEIKALRCQLEEIDRLKNRHGRDAGAR